MTVHQTHGFTAPGPRRPDHRRGRRPQGRGHRRRRRAYAFDDACTHAQCSLSGDEVEDGAVICPCHFASFDIGTGTGAVRTGPAKNALRCYRAQLTDGVLALEVPG